MDEEEVVADTDADDGCWWGEEGDTTEVDGDVEASSTVNSARPRDLANVTLATAIDCVGVVDDMKEPDEEDAGGDSSDPDAGSH